jgi:hypothetical protein
VPFPIFFENGRVGIGEQTPEVELDVVGDVAVSGDVEIAGALTVAGGTVTGIALAAVGSSPNANGATLSAGNLALQPASASFPGVVTAGAQTLAGAKTLANDLTLATGVVNSSVADGASAVAHEFDTATLSTAGAKIASFRNANSEKLAIDKDGKLLGTFATPQTIDMSYGGNGIKFSSGSGSGGGFYFTDRFDNVFAEVQSFSLNLATAQGGIIKFNATDSTGTPGNATINKASGKSAVASGAQTCVVTNNLCTASSIVMVTPLAVDTAAPLYKAVPAAGSFTVTTYNNSGVATNVAANWSFSWIVFNN